MLAFGMPGGLEMAIIGMVGLLIFGNRLPSVARSIGSSIVEFKKGFRDVKDGIEEVQTGVKELEKDIKGEINAQ